MAQLAAWSTPDAGGTTREMKFEAIEDESGTGAMETGKRKRALWSTPQRKNERIGNFACEEFENPNAKNRIESSQITNKKQEFIFKSVVLENRELGKIFL